MSSSKTKVTEEIDSSTNVLTTNQQATASEGSIAVGAGANVTIESLDSDVVNSSLKAVESISGQAQATAAKALDSNISVTESALNFGRDNVSTIASTLSQANSLLSKSFESSANILQRSGGVDESTIRSESNSSDKILIGSAIAAILALTFIGRKGGK